MSSSDIIQATRRQDLIGVLKVQGNLDRDYMQQWAQQLGVSDLLQKALNDIPAPPVD